MVWRIIYGILTIIALVEMVLLMTGVFSPKPEVTAPLVWLALALIWAHKAGFE